jgi:hypothetical protein
MVRVNTAGEPEGRCMVNPHSLFLEEAHVVPASNRQGALLAPKVEQLHYVIAEAMLEEESMHPPRNPLHWAASIVVRFTVLGFLLILPLYFIKRAGHAEI